MSKLRTEASSLQSLSSSLLEEARQGLVAYQPTTLSLGNWAQENRNFKGRPFGFDGHEYLREVYSDALSKHPYIVLEKAAQMGASEYAMTRLFWFLDRYPKTKAIFFLPSERLVQDFSSDRVSPIIDDSPRLMKIATGSQNVGLKHIGHSSLYMRGMFHKSGVKSVDADFIVFDELDEAAPKNKQQAIERISHSKHGYVLELSTPTLPGYGIDLEWGNTDQRFWHVACGCHEGVILEDTFPECVVPKGDGWVLRCPRCGKEDIDPNVPAVVGEYAGWIPKCPEKTEKRGYHLTQLFSKVIPLSRIMTLWHSGRDRDEFYNSKLGLPFAGDRMPLTLEVLRGCYGGEYALEPKRENEGERIFMGVDQGLELHIWMTKELPSGKRQVIWAERTKYAAGYDPFERVSQLIKKVKPNCTVIDAMPNIVPARQLADAHRNVYCAHYNETTKDRLKFDRETKKVIAHRTDCIDEMVDDWIQQQLVIPSGNSEVEFSFSHFKSMAKVIETDEESGVSRYVYIHVGPDHYAHAATYEWMAANGPYGRSHFAML